MPALHIWLYYSYAKLARSISRMTLVQETCVLLFLPTLRKMSVMLQIRVDKVQHKHMISLTLENLLLLGKLHVLGEWTVVFTAAWVAFTVSPGTVSIHQDVVRGTGGMAGQRDVTEVVTCIELPHNGVSSDDTGTDVEGDTSLNPAHYSLVGNTPAPWLRCPNQIASC